ncbi:conserved hypothetical protein [Burkholderiales bacterium]|nr:conserved hypothetical protein [Burkholderiales bacterium]
MESAREKLVGDIKVLLTDVDALFRQAAASSGEEARKLRERAESALQEARARFETIQDDIISRGRDAAHATDDWVHHNPWSSIGLGAGIGLLIGFLIARR